MDLVCPAGVVAERADDFCKIFVESHGVGFSIVPGFEGGEGFFVGFEEVCEFVDDGAAVGGGEITPGWVLEGCAGGTDGEVDVRGGGSLDGGNGGFVGWVYAGNCAAGGFDEFVVDEETSWEGDFSAVGGCEVDGETHFVGDGEVTLGGLMGEYGCWEGWRYVV